MFREQTNYKHHTWNERCATAVQSISTQNRSPPMLFHLKSNNDASLPWNWQVNSIDVSCLRLVKTCAHQVRFFIHSGHSSDNHFSTNDWKVQQVNSEQIWCIEVLISSSLSFVSPFFFFRLFIVLNESHMWCTIILKRTETQCFMRFCCCYVSSAWAVHCCFFFNQFDCNVVSRPKKKTTMISFRNAPNA